VAPAIITSCARCHTICPRPCTPHAAAQLQPIHDLRLRRPARLGFHACAMNIHDVRDRQTDKCRQTSDTHHFIMPPERGIIIPRSSCIPIYELTCESRILKTLCAVVPNRTRPTRTWVGPMLSWLTMPRMKLRIAVQSEHELLPPQTRCELSTMKTRFARANEHRFAAATAHQLSQLKPTVIRRVHLHSVNGYCNG